MCELFPCIPIIEGFIFFKKVLWEQGFKFLCESNSPVSRNTHCLLCKNNYRLKAADYFWKTLPLRCLTGYASRYRLRETGFLQSWHVMGSTERQFHCDDVLMKDYVENLKLQFDHDSFYLCLLYLVLLWLGFLMLNRCSEKHDGTKLIRNNS